MSNGKAAKHPALALVGSLLSYVALCITVLAALVLIVVPLLTGSQTYSVLTSSMAPHYAPGTFLVVKPTPYNELQVGDVVTYQMESGKPAVITHRIISFGVDQAGNRTLITQGDNNDIADEQPVTELQVRGKLFYAVPFVGFAANALGNTDRGAAVQWAAVGLLGYGVVTLVRGTLARKRRGGPAAGQGVEDAGAEVAHLPASRIDGADAVDLDHSDPVLGDCDCGADHHDDSRSLHQRRVAV
ncbi:Signal peptidase I W [Arthrobacter saudimassiliensis]|uniref:Signal peptidase I n=1 Tax=Arthrobacter saudimassiliensis TaxID=1461584 RepID=A0A078MMK9_9MICC|nr:Signal peptidase I W [Arthrobacter saudimassiliensis]